MNIRRLAARTKSKRPSKPAQPEHNAEAVVHLGRLALVGTPVPELLRAAPRLLTQHLRVERAGVLELRGDVLVVAATDGWEDGEEGMELPLVPGSPLARLIEADGPVTAEDLGEACDVRAGITVAIRGGDGCFGLIGAYSTQPRVFSPDDHAFVAELALVIEHAVAAAREVAA